VIIHPIGVVVCVGVGVAQVDFATSVFCSENCFVGLNQNRGGVVLGVGALLKALLLTLPYAGVAGGVVVAFSIDDFGDSDVVIVVVVVVVGVAAAAVGVDVIVSSGGDVGVDVVVSCCGDAR